MGLDEESLTSREKPTEEVKIDKTIDIQGQSKQEQEQLMKYGRVLPTHMFWQMLFLTLTVGSPEQDVYKGENS